MKEIAFSTLSPLSGKRSRMVSIGMKMRALLPLFPSRPTLREDTDDVEAGAVEQDAGADGGTARENVLEEFPADYADAAALEVVFIVEPAADIDG